MIARLRDELVGQPVCGRCGTETVPIMYMGAPGRLCPNDECRALSGLALRTAGMWFNGWFVKREPGMVGYFKALWAWLTEAPEDGTQ